MYFSYPGHPAFVGLLFKTFSVRGKPFHFLLALTLTFWEGSLFSFLSGYLSALAWMRTKIAWISKSKRMYFSCLSTFQNIFRSRQTIFDRMYYPILVILVYFSKHFPFKANRFIFCQLWLWLFKKDLPVVFIRLSYSSRMNANKNCMDFQKEKDVFFLSTFQNVCLAFLTGCIILFWSFWFSFFVGFPTGCIFLILVIQPLLVYFSKHCPFEANHFIFCWLWLWLFEKDLRLFFLSGYLSALAWMRTKIAWISKRKRMHFSCLHFLSFSIQGKPLHFLFRNIFRSRKTISSSVGFDIVFLTKISEQFMMYSSHFFWRHSKRMYLSYSGHSACVCLLFKTFPVQDKLFLTGCIILFWFLTRWQDVLSYSGHSGSLFWQAFHQDVFFLSWSFSYCWSTFQNIFHLRQTVSFSVGFDFGFLRRFSV